MFVILYNQRGECAIGKAKFSELYTIYGTIILVRFQSLLLLSNSFLILVSEYVTDKFIHSKSSCVPFVRIAHIIFLTKKKLT